MVLVLLCIVYRANRLQKMSLKVDFINWNLNTAGQTLDFITDP